MGFVPDFVTHYYRASRRPFLNLSDLDDAEGMLIMLNMIDERRLGLQHRPFGASYLEMRRVAEARLRGMLEASGGIPRREAPHYFVLGESPWFRGLAEDMAEIRLPITALPEAQTTVTWGDSFSVTATTRDFGLHYEPRPYHGQLYRLSDIPALVDAYGLHVAPAGEYGGLSHGLAPTAGAEPFVEVQLWSDEPVRSWL